MTTARVTELYEQIKALPARELAELLRLLRPPGEPPAAGVREPRRPPPPIDARGLPLDAEHGKTDAL